MLQAAAQSGGSYTVRFGIPSNAVHNPILLTLFNFALGATLGVAGGLLGIGGGLIAIPVLGYLYGMDQHLAQGTALVMIAPNVAMGFYRYHQKHRIDLRQVALAALCAMASTYVAARLASSISASGLHTAFAVFLIVLALYFGFPSRRNPQAVPAQEKPAPSYALPLLGLGSGAMSGIFTVGGGLIVVPALVALLRMAQTRAQGVAMALVAPGAVVALFAYAQGGHVSWSTGVPMAVGGVLTVSWGVHLAHKWPPSRLRVLFCLVLLGTATAMLVTGH